MKKNWQFITLLIALAISLMGQVKSYGAIEQVTTQNAIDICKLTANINALSKELSRTNVLLATISGYIDGKESIRGTNPPR